MEDAPAVAEQHYEHTQHAKSGGGDGVDRGDVLRKVRLVGDRGPSRRPEYLATVVCETSRPSICEDRRLRRGELLKS